MVYSDEVAPRHYKKPCPGCEQLVDPEDEHGITFVAGEFRVFHDECWDTFTQSFRKGR